MQLSVVVPAYREGPRIYDNLQRLVAELDQLGSDYEVLVVSDGNTDRTAEEAERVSSPRVTVLQYPVNRGKGFALGYGVGRSTGELVTFIDADMELDPSEIKRFIELLHEQDADIVIGSKRHRLSRVHYPIFRRLQSFVYQVLIRLLFCRDVLRLDPGDVVAVQVGGAVRVPSGRRRGCRGVVVPARTGVIVRRREGRCECQRRDHRDTEARRSHHGQRESRAQLALRHRRPDASAAP